MAEVEWNLLICLTKGKSKQTWISLTNDDRFEEKATPPERPGLQGQQLLGLASAIMDLDPETVGPRTRESKPIPDC
jgi:hypothetical protein